jgi:hypothetical protein
MEKRPRSVRLPRRTPRSPNLRPSRLTPDLRTQFDRLLITWTDPERRRRRRVPVRWEKLSAELAKRGAQRDKIILKYERRYGDGHFKDRQNRLAEMLEWLGEEGADFTAVLSALRQARVARREALAVGREADFLRLLADHQRIVPNLRQWVAKARGSYTALIAADSPVAFEAVDILIGRASAPLWLNHREVLDTLAALLDDDPTQVLRLTGRTRRARAGRQAEPWLAAARQEIRTAGVPDGGDDELFVIVGLVRYQPPSKTQFKAPISTGEN